MMNKILTLLIVIMLCGCIHKYEDVSKHPEYMPFLNTCYSLKNDMYIFGVNLDRGYGKDIHIFDIKPKNMRIRGPEIITEDILREGTILKVQSLRRSLFYVFFEGRVVEAVVAVTPYAKATDVPIVIELEYLQSKNVSECKTKD